MVNSRSRLREDIVDADKREAIRAELASRQQKYLFISSCRADYLRRASRRRTRDMLRYTYISGRTPPEYKARHMTRPRWPNCSRFAMGAHIFR